MPDRFSTTLTKALAILALLLLTYGYFQPHMALIAAERQKVEQVSAVLKNVYAIASRDTSSSTFKYLSQVVRP